MIRKSNEIPQDLESPQNQKLRQKIRKLQHQKYSWKQKEQALLQRVAELEGKLLAANISSPEKKFSEYDLT